MGRTAAQIELTDAEEAELKRWRRRRNTSTGLHFRSGIVLDCAKGYSGEEIAERHQTSQQKEFKREQVVSRRLLTRSTIRKRLALNFAGENLPTLVAPLH